MPHKAMLVSVGGSPAPLCKSIDTYRPEYVIYFASKSSRRMVREEIEPALAHRPKDHEIIVTPDENDLVACAKELLRELPRKLHIWDLSFTDLTGDYTGGTKSMSAAVVLALLGRGAAYCYVGGDLRDKNGLGAVRNGHEVLLSLQNPWDVLAVNTLRDLALFFNNHHFMPAAELACEASRAAGGLKPLFDILNKLALGYYNWDSFNYKGACNTLNNVASSLATMAAVNNAPALQELLGHLKRNIADLELLVQEQQSGGGVRMVHDIVANAIRRADDGHHHDDAVARLYSAIEKAAKVRLRMEYGLDNGNLDLTRIEDNALRQELQDQCTDSRDSRVKLPLHRSYRLLLHLGDALGERYAANEEQLRNLLNIRNDSLLAHGFKPVRESTFSDMLSLALDFLSVEREHLPRFPVLDGEKLGMVVW